MKLQEYRYNRQIFIIDYRLEQFRRVDWNTGQIHFLEFYSELGEKILCKMIKDNKADFSKLNL